MLGEAALELRQHFFGIGHPPLPLQLLDSLEPFLGRLLLEAMPHRQPILLGRLRRHGPCR